MSEEDRATKAARAKAMLKKRQQKKVTDSVASVASSSIESPVSPQRTFSPAPTEHVEEDGRDLGNVFAQDTSDTTWLSSLPRVTSPPLPQSLRGGSTNNGSPDILPQVPAVPTGVPSHSQSLQLSSVDFDSFKKIQSLTKDNEDLSLRIKQLDEVEVALQQTEATLVAERQTSRELRDSYQKLREETEIALKNERRTVALLVTEKAHLTSELQNKDDLEEKAQVLGQQLVTERSKTADLEGKASQLQAQVLDLSEREKQLERAEKELQERFKEQERQLQIATASGADARKETEEFKRRLRELEEQVQSDDRVERLESSLKHTQDRADELEFQLSKLKQAHSFLKTERDNLEIKVRQSSEKEPELQAKISELEGKLAPALEDVDALKNELESTSEEKSKFQSLSEAHERTIKEYEEKLLQAAAAMAANSKQLQQIQNELKSATRRADDAEKMQKSLQAEGTKLMQALEEMRPKIVELTASKLELSEKIESLEHTVRNKDSVIVQLENDLGETHDQLERAEEIWKERIREQEKRHLEMQTGTTTLQKAYAELQEELDSALTSLRNLESQRTNLHQEASRRVEEIERLKSQSQAQHEELESLRNEVDARTKANEEEQEFLERAQNEIEALRAEMNSRDDEIEQLREKAANITSPAQSEAPRSLDEELVASIKQQHALDMSNATAQIRALENTVFDKESLNHNLQKQIHVLEEQLSKLKASTRHVQIQPPSRPSSRADHPDSSRRSSLNLHRPHILSHHHGHGHQTLPLSRTIFDHVMTPETMHKRKVSLSMLKARIDNENKLASATGSPVSSSRALSPVHSEGGSASVAGSRAHSRLEHVATIGHRPQFLDESHVFWCHSCRGDLVIL